MDSALWYQESDSRQVNQLYLDLKSYRPFSPLLHETDNFIVRTATHGRDLIEALRLRHEIFYKEWRDESAPYELDVDEFDFQADHLLIIEKASDEVVGTYRLISSDRNKPFYSQSEFEMESFLSRAGSKLELGRACIRADHRNGNTIDLLWKGLAAYIKQSGSRWLFGCASVHCTDSQQLGELLKFLDQNGQLERNYPIWPKIDYIDRQLYIPKVGQFPPLEIKRLLPPLLRSYLQAGAKVFGFPAYDKDFKCFDLLTVLDVEEISPRYYSRYFLNENGR